MKIYDLKQELINQKSKNKEYVWEEFEKCRSKYPIVYNIETTNACNMKCEMCPRTTLMNRPVKTMDMATFRKIIKQIRPFSDSEWREWEGFVRKHYGISKDDMSENHFFLYIIPRVLVLHGYGDPLLDKNMPERIKLLAENNIPSYFSCNPANINLERTENIFREGLDYIKFSIESADDILHKKIRGKASNFTKSYEKILHLLDLKKRYGYKTTIAVTMLDLHRFSQEEEFNKLQESFKDKDIYIYLKSQDQQWYQNKKCRTKSIHWTEFCQFPWSSMTIKSDGEAAMCVEDYNNEIILGDTKKETLYGIWNGEKYRKIREDHFNLTRGIKCTKRCDMNLVGNLINDK